MNKETRMECGMKEGLKFGDGRQAYFVKKTPWRSLAKSREQWRARAINLAGVTRAPVSNAPG